MAKTGAPPAGREVVAVLLAADREIPEREGVLAGLLVDPDGVTGFSLAERELLAFLLIELNVDAGPAFKPSCSSLGL